VAQVTEHKALSSNSSTTKKERKKKKKITIKTKSPILNITPLKNMHQTQIVVTFEEEQGLKDCWGWESQCKL
jgi:hypothetical protein